MQYTMPWRHNNAVQMRIAWLYCTHVFMSLSYVTAEAENTPLCDQQHGIRQANLRFAGCVICIIEVNTRCATSDVNPFKIRCKLQITNATVNETQWWHIINDVTNDMKLTSAIGVLK